MAKKKKNKTPKLQRIINPTYEKLVFMRDPALGNSDYQAILSLHHQELSKLNTYIVKLEKDFREEMTQLKEIVTGSKTNPIPVLVKGNEIRFLSKKMIEGLNIRDASKYVEPLQSGASILQEIMSKFSEDQKILEASNQAIQDLREKAEKYLELPAWKDWNLYLRFTQNLTLLGYPKKEATAYRKVTRELKRIRSFLEESTKDHIHQYKFERWNRTNVVCRNCRRTIHFDELQVTAELPSQAEIKRKLKFLKEGKQLPFEVAENEFAEGARHIQKLQPILKRKTVQNLLQELVQLESKVGKPANLQQEEHWQTLLTDIPELFCKEKDPNWMLDFDFHTYKKNQEQIDEVLTDIKIYQDKPTEFLAYLKQRKKTLEQQYQSRLDSTPLPNLNAALLTEEQLKILFETATFLEGRFGRHRLVEMLKGSDTQMARNYNFSSYQHFGALQHLAQTKVLAVVDELIAKKFLDTVDYEYPKVALTEKGRLLFEKLKQANGKKLKLILDTLSFDNVLLLLTSEQITLKDAVKYIKKRYQNEGLPFFKLVLETPSIRRVENPDVEELVVAIIEERNLPILRYHEVWSKDTKFGQFVKSLLEKYEKRVKKEAKKVVS